MKKNAINNWFKRNTEAEEKTFRGGVLAFAGICLIVIFFGKGIFY